MLRIGVNFWEDLGPLAENLIPRHPLVFLNDYISIIYNIIASIIDFEAENSHRIDIMQSILLQVCHHISWMNPSNIVEESFYDLVFLQASY